LEKSYVKTSGRISALVKSASGICLTSDGWSSINSEPIINYCGVTSDHTFFLECVYTQTQSHSKEFIADNISRVIEKDPQLRDKIVGCCTDNTNTNKAAWKIPESKYPEKFFYGCVCHVLHLLVKDIISKLD